MKIVKVLCYSTIFTVSSFGGKLFENRASIGVQLADTEHQQQNYLRDLKNKSGAHIGLEQDHHEQFKGWGEHFTIVFNRIISDEVPPLMDNAELLIPLI